MLGLLSILSFVFVSVCAIVNMCQEAVDIII